MANTLSLHDALPICGINECLRKLRISLEALEQSNREDEKDVERRIKFLEDIRAGKGK